MTSSPTKLLDGPSKRVVYRLLAGLLVVANCLASGRINSPAIAQDKSRGGIESSFAMPPMPGFGAEQQVEFSAWYDLVESDGGSSEGRIYVQAELAPKWHLYSVTQAPGGPLKTTIAVQTEGVTTTGPFTPDVAPALSENDVWVGLTIEEHSDTVVWSAPVRLAAPSGENPSDIKVRVRGQVCQTDGACIPVNETLNAKFREYYADTAQVTELRAKNTHAVWSATMEPATIAPGGSAIIKLKAQTDPGYHIYPYVAGEEDTDFRTLIVATNKGGLLLGTPTTAAEIKSVDLGLEAPIEYYAGPVEWTIPVTAPESAELGERVIELLVGFYTCDDKSCDPPAGIKFTGTLTVAEQASDQAVPMGTTLAKYVEVASAPNLANWMSSSPEAEAEAKTVAPARALELWMVASAILGGFILNFMPCVLPVIGLKLMSFVSQSGNDHRRVVALNLSYTAGILAVLLVLALANIAAKNAGNAFGWGEQFQSMEFVVALTVLLFAMSLSFLGVWEIPIPGFATSSKSGELMEKEGLDGAFYKGILTTVLATPCSGPFLGAVFGLTLTLSTPSILLLYLCVGIGLAMPYLALCVSPGFLKLMPKPGAWMDTLKQLLAFPLLFTVVYFVSIVSPDYRIATLTLLIVVWFACWLIGRVPPYAERRRLATAWIGASAVVVLGAFIGFTYFGPSNHALPWVPYSDAALAKHRQEGKTVMVEFTASWCLTCQYNMKFAIDRPDVADLVKENDVVTLLADLSEPDEMISRKVQELGALSIPLLAVYPPDPDAEPIVLRDVITETQLLEALREAGPSLNDAAPGRLTSSRKID